MSKFLDEARKEHADSPFILSTHENGVKHFMFEGGTHYPLPAFCKKLTDKQIIELLSIGAKHGYHHGFSWGVIEKTNEIRSVLR